MIKKKPRLLGPASVPLLVLPAVHVDIDASNESWQEGILSVGNRYT